MEFDDWTELAEGRKEGRLVRTGRATATFIYGRPAAGVNLAESAYR